jgi:hypothetical protein
MNKKLSQQQQWLLDAMRENGSKWVPKKEFTVNGKIQHNTIESLVRRELVEKKNVNGVTWYRLKPEKPELFTPMVAAFFLAKCFTADIDPQVTHTWRVICNQKPDFKMKLISLISDCSVFAEIISELNRQIDDEIKERMLVEIILSKPACQTDSSNPYRIYSGLLFAHKYKAAQAYKGKYL